jgi:hypothetical protein
MRGNAVIPADSRGKVPLRYGSDDLEQSPRRSDERL